jgi:transcriptional regulator with XRE-family HTH domain
MASKNWNWKAIEASLKAQGWRVEYKDARHVRCIPPTKGKPMVVCSTTGKHHRGTRNAMQQLKASGFDPSFVPPRGMNSSAPAPVSSNEEAEPMTTLPEFGPTLKRLREEAKLKQGELGDLVGVGGSAVSGWEKGKAAPHNADTYRKLCELLPELKTAKAPSFKRQCKNKPPGKFTEPVPAAPPTLESQSEPAHVPPPPPMPSPPPPKESAVVSTSSHDPIAAAAALGDMLYLGDSQVLFKRADDGWLAQLVVSSEVLATSGSFAYSKDALRALLGALRAQAMKRREELDRLMDAAGEGA